MLLAAGASAATYYVSPAGNDRSDGTTPATAWQTLERSSLALRAGDTLILREGFYRPTLVLAGAAEAGEDTAQPVTIRAERPGAAILHGDIPLDGFTAAPGLEQVYKRALPAPVSAIVESDTDIVYEKVGSPADAAEVIASWHYDATNRELYVHTTDGGSPDRHALWGSIHAGGGYYKPPASTSAPARTIVVDGLVFKGFGFHRMALDLRYARNLTVRNCVFYHNCYGIYLAEWARNVRIENNLVFANNMPRAGSPEQAGIFVGGDLAGIVVDGNVARHNRFNNIRFYGGVIPEGEAVTFSNNRCYGEGPVWFKPNPRGSRMVGNVAEGFAGTDFASHNTFPAYTGEYVPARSEGDLLYGNNREGRDAAKFVDPINGDYRLQSDSPFRGKAKDGSDLGAFPYKGDVFFVKPDGDDKAEGTSVAAAWKSLAHATARLKPGDTLYLMAGTYAEPIRIAAKATGESPIAIRRHGADRVVIAPRRGAGAAIALEGAQHVEIEGLEIRGAKAAGLEARDCASLKITQCLVHDSPGAGIRIENSRDVTLKNNTLARNGEASLAVAGASGELAVIGNLLQGNRATQVLLDAASAERWYGNCNGFFGPPLASVAGRACPSLTDLQAACGERTNSLAADALFADAEHDDFRLRVGSPCRGRGEFERTIGRDDLVPVVPEDLDIRDVRVHDVGGTTATVTFRTPTKPCYAMALVEGAGEAARTILLDTEQRIVHSISLIGLKTNTEYTIKVGGKYAKKSWIEHTRQAWGQGGASPEPDAMAWAAPVAVRTLAADLPGQTLHVRQEGRDDRDGLTPATAWRTLRQACRRARAGDTVRVGPGRYFESIAPLNSGASDARRITFRSEEPRAAVLDGNDFTIAGAVRLNGKHYITVDGFRMDYQTGIGYSMTVGGGFYPQVVISQSRGCTVSNCYLNGAPPFPSVAWTSLLGLWLNEAEGAVIENNFFIKQTWDVWDTTSKPYATNAVCPLLKNNTFFCTYIWTLHLTGRDVSLKLRNNVFGERVRRKTGLANIRLWTAEARLDSDYNFFWWHLSSKGQPELQTVGMWHNRFTPPEIPGGLAKWREKTGQDLHSLEAFFPTGNIYDQLDFRIAGKPYQGKGENSADMGCPWLGRHTTDVVLEEPDSPVDVPPWRATPAQK